MIAPTRLTPLLDPGARVRGPMSTDDGAARTRPRVSGELPAAMLSRGQVARVLAALLQEDIRRDTGRTISRARIIETDRLDEDGIGLDSLARLRAIATVTEFFGLAVTGVEDYLVVDPRLTAWTDVVGHHLHLRRALTDVTFSTSGTSGLTPKRARHNLGDLFAEVDAVAAVLGDAQSGRVNGDVSRVLASVPPHHIYGFLFTVLLPDRLDCPLLDLSELPPSAALRSAAPGDLIVGTPFTWQLACDGGARAATGCLGLVSTAPCPPTLWVDTHAAGVERLVELYGSSETSGIGWRDSPEAPLRLLSHLGRIDDHPARHAVALPLQDHLEWVGPRCFRLGGRIDGSVQIGGQNVVPAAVARTLADVDGVADVTVRLDGDRLKAFVVPVVPSSDGNDALESRLRAAAACHLAPPARPARYTFGQVLPRNAMGKPADWIDDPVSAH